MGSLQASVLSSEQNLLHEKYLVIGTIQLPPYVFYTNVSTNGQINDSRGFIYEIVLYMAAKYHFNFEYVKPSDGSYGSFQNESWNGLIGMLHRKDLDLAAACLVVTYPRSTAVDFTVQFYDDLVSLLIPYPTLDSTINGITRPFQYEVWLLILISVVAMTVCTWKIFSMELWAFDKKRTIYRPSFYGSFWSLLDFHNTVRRHVKNSSRWPVNILATVWCLTTFVLINAYSSTLTAYLLTPRYHPMADSIEDIASISRPVFMVGKYTSYESNSKSVALLKIGDTLRKYPELRTPTTGTQSNRDNIAESIIQNQRSFTTVKSSLLDFLENDL